MSDKTHETFVANEDLSTHQYKIVVNSDGKLVARQVTAGGQAIGVLNDAPSSGRHASVVYNGFSKCFAGGTIVGGNEITSTLSGTATLATSGDYVVGTALTSVASGSIFDMVVTHAGWKGL